MPRSDRSVVDLESFHSLCNLENLGLSVILDYGPFCAANGRWKAFSSVAGEAGDPSGSVWVAQNPLCLDKIEPPLIRD